MTRDRQIALRLTPEELDEWTAAAAADGRPLSQWVRRMVERGRNAIVSRVPSGTIPAAGKPSRKLRKP